MNATDRRNAMIVRSGQQHHTLPNISVKAHLGTGAGTGLKVLERRAAAAAKAMDLAANRFHSRSCGDRRQHFMSIIQARSAAGSLARCTCSMGSAERHATTSIACWAAHLGKVHCQPRCFLTQMCPVVGRR